MATAFPALSDPESDGIAPLEVRNQFGRMARWLTEYQLETGVISCLAVLRELAQVFDMGDGFYASLGCVAGEPLALVFEGLDPRVIGVLRRDAVHGMEINASRLAARGEFRRIAFECIMGLYAAFGWQPAHTVVERDPGGEYDVNLGRFPKPTLRSWFEKKGLR